MGTFKDESEWLDAVLKRSKLTQSELGRYFEEKGLVRSSGAQVIHNISKGDRRLLWREALYIERKTGLRAELDKDENVIMAGDDEVDYPEEAIEIVTDVVNKNQTFVELPPEIRGEVIALIVGFCLKEKIPIEQSLKKSTLLENVVEMLLLANRKFLKA